MGAPSGPPAGAPPPSMGRPPPPMQAAQQPGMSGPPPMQGFVRPMVSCRLLCCLVPAWYLPGTCLVPAACLILAAACLIRAGSGPWPGLQVNPRSRASLLSREVIHAPRSPPCRASRPAHRLAACRRRSTRHSTRAWAARRRACRIRASRRRRPGACRRPWARRRACRRCSSRRRRQEQCTRCVAVSVRSRGASCVVCSLSHLLLHAHNSCSMRGQQQGGQGGLWGGGHHAACLTQTERRAPHCLPASHAGRRAGPAAAAATPAPDGRPATASAAHDGRAAGAWAPADGHAASRDARLCAGGAASGHAAALLRTA